MNEKKVTFPRRIRSFVKRDSRITDAQRKAIETMWPVAGLDLRKEFYNFADIFQRQAPRILEIGFGSGTSLLAMAANHPEQDFIGIETHQPGVGAIMLGMEQQSISNLRIFHADAVEVLQQCIPDQSLDVIQIFFPDPWQKRRHHKRRLIQTAFVNMLIKKLKPGGMLHLATDWEDYAVHMMKVLSEIAELVNSAGPEHYSNRSSQRPVVTKFERRGVESGREIWELQFTRV